MILCGFCVAQHNISYSRDSVRVDGVKAELQTVRHAVKCSQCGIRMVAYLKVPNRRKEAK